jgi:hypothetical protein
MRYFLRRSRAFWISVFNIIGLLCSMSGVLLLFWYALPNWPPDEIGFQWSAPWEAQRRLYRWYAELGLWLVLLGTVLEAVPPACTAIGSWRRRPNTFGGRLRTPPSEHEP